MVNIRIIVSRLFQHRGYLHAKLGESRWTLKPPLWATLLVLHAYSAFAYGQIEPGNILMAEVKDQPAPALSGRTREADQSTSLEQALSYKVSERPGMAAKILIDATDQSDRISTAGKAIELYGLYIKHDGCCSLPKWYIWPAPIAKLLRDDADIGRLVPNIGVGVNVSVKTVDISRLSQSATTVNVIRSGWVAATKSEIEELSKLDENRARARERLTEIEKELEDLDRGLPGKEVKGAASEAAVRRVVRDGVVVNQVLGVSPQNTYRVGVREDVQNREAKRVKLREERDRLRGFANKGSLLNNGQVWRTDLKLTVPAVHVTGTVRRQLIMKEQEGYNRLYGSVTGFWEQFDVDDIIEIPSDTFDASKYFTQLQTSGAAMNAGLIAVARNVIWNRIELHCNELKNKYPPEVVEQERAAARWLFGIE